MLSHGAQVVYGMPISQITFQGLTESGTVSGIGIESLPALFAGSPAVQHKSRRYLWLFALASLK